MIKKEVYIVTPFNTVHYKGWLKSVLRLFKETKNIKTTLVSIDFGKSDMDMTFEGLFKKDNENLNFTDSLKFLFKLYNFARRHKDSNYLIPEFRFPNFLTLPALKLAGAKNIFVRIAGQEYKDEGTKSAKVRRFLLKFTKNVIVLNNHTFEEVKRIGANPVMIPNPVDTSKFKFKEHSFEGNTLNLLQVGEICKRKNTLFVIEIWQKLLENGVNANLTIVGPILKKDEYTNSVEKILKRDNRINWVDYTDDIFTYYKQNDHFLFPSESEGMPNVLLEAAACGLFCVASKIPGSTEILENNCGILIQNKDINGYVGAVMNTSNSEKREFCKNAISKIKNDHALTVIENKYIEILS